MLNDDKFKLKTNDNFKLKTIAVSNYSKVSKTIYDNQCQCNFVPKHLQFEIMTVSSMWPCFDPIIKIFPSTKIYFREEKHLIQPSSAIDTMKGN